MTGTPPEVPLYRTEIERALDELIPYEEGMRFQALAVVLAKKKWPDLIACERKKDLGLDAYASASLAPDRVGKVLACSISATLEKIKGDARKVQENYPDTKVIVFATPVKVTNQTGQGWAEEIRKNFGFELVIMPREDIITSLMDPANALLCRTMLGMAVPIPAAEIPALDAVRDASRKVTAAWLSHPRLSGRPRIALQGMRLDQAGSESGEVLSLSELQDLLSQGRRLILDGAAGRGKTTTLVEIAQQRIDNGQLAMLVDLPEWVRSRQDITEFIARMPEYRARDIHAGTLARLSRVEHFSFLLNGWNEISEAYSEEAVRALAQLERDYPAAGIIVATRTHHTTPPLPGASRIRLLPLNRAQRSKYLRDVLGNRGEELRLQLEGNRVLDALTRTPLVLSEVATLFQSGLPIPRTRVGVLSAVMQLMETAEEHRDHLQRPPLLGKAQVYLKELARQMTVDGEVRIADEQARALCLTVSTWLKEALQIATLPEPADILNTLCAHHVLERLDYPSPAYRFEHQQFQEFYAAAALQHYIQHVVLDGGPAEAQTFARQYVNLPFWEEPLCMIAEEVATQASDPSLLSEASRMGDCLVETALPIDPIVAAELTRLSGPAVSRKAHAKLAAYLRSWYAVADQHHRQCALAGMLASGSAEFSDILVPLLASDDRQVRLRTYRAGGEFHLSTLGPDWRRVVAAWGEDQRIDFIHEAMRNRWSSELGEGFALADPSPRVRNKAIEELHWYGADDTLVAHLNGLNDEDFDAALDALGARHVPRPLWPRAIACFRKRLSSIEEPTARLRLLLAMQGWGDAKAYGDIKSELARFSVGRVDDHTESLLQSAMEIVGTSEPGWASKWTLARLMDGSLWRDQWLHLLTDVPIPLQEQILSRSGSEDLQHARTHRLAEILVKANDPAVVGAAVGRLIEIRQKIASEPNHRHELEWKLEHQLKGLLRSFPTDTLVAGLLSRVRGRMQPIEHTLATEIVGVISADTPTLRDSLPEPLRQELREYLLNGMPLILSANDFSGELKMHFAVALGRVGDPEDMNHLERLVQVDIDRLRTASGALSRGERSEMANGARMRCANWHIHAIVQLHERAAENVLLRLLCEPEYEEEAGKGLVRLASIAPLQGWTGHAPPDYRKMWEARAGRHVSDFDAEKGLRYATAINRQIDVIGEVQRGSDKPESFTRRLKPLAAMVARLDGRNSASRVLEIMALPAEWDGWLRTDALGVLLFCGATLPTDATLAVINPTLDHIQKHGIQGEQNMSLLKLCLCLLPFVEAPAVGIERVEQILSAANIWHHALRELVIALGHSRCDAALPVLRRLAIGDANKPSLIGSELIKSLAALDTEEARQMLLGFVDPSLTQPGINVRVDFHDEEQLASSLAELARRQPSIGAHIFRLCEAQLPQQNRLLLSKVVARIGTQEAFMAGLKLLSDSAVPNIPPNLVRGVESAFVEQRPLYGNVYTQEPRSSNEVRAQLFDLMLNDEARRRSAFALLGYIEVWRLDYGRPNTEPRHPAIETGAPWPPLDVINQTRH